MAWSRAIGTLSQRVERLSAGLATSVRINVVYHVAGKVAPNEFDGVRTGRFDKAQSLLVVQAAVPKRVPEEPEALLVELLDAAVLAAEAWGRRRGIAGDLSAMRNLVRRVAHRTSNAPRQASFPNTGAAESSQAGSMRRASLIGPSL
jgi:hypothetical protein